MLSIDSQAICGIYTKCVDCELGIAFIAGFNLCFKCSRFSSKLHPSTHHLVQYGDHSSPQPASEAAASVGGHSVPGDLILDRPVYEVEDVTVDLVPDLHTVPVYENDDED